MPEKIPMPDSEGKPERLKTPSKAEGRSTPDRTPSPSAETTELDTADLSLRALAARYDTLEEIGRGGMGIVYRARDRETGDVVALKVLRPEIAGWPELIERFKAELLLARKVTHKNICRTYELLRFGDTVAIAMEYVEGESLRSLLGRVEGLSVRQSLKIFRQVLAGLAEAHAQGVVHRDLKPENILLTCEGSVKVMDFGISRSLETPATHTTGIIGTPAYMSPEQAEGRPTDARTDIYSLGLILYEMLTGCPAFHAETPVGLAYKQVHERPASARSADPYLPVFLDRAIEKCLEKDPKKRFQSVAQLEGALEEQAVPELTEVAEPKPAPHLSVWGRRDWVLLALGVLGLVYFLEFRNAVFPAATKPLEVDAISARRAAEDLATRLGRPFPGRAQAELVYRGEEYWDALFPATIANPFRASPEELSKGLRAAELPLAWKVTFNAPTESRFWSSSVPDRYAVVNRQGKVKELLYPFPLEWVSPKYQPAPTEQRQAVAREAATAACGGLARDMALVETSGGEQNASYSLVFKPPRPLTSAPWVRISLLAEKVITVDCKPRASNPGFVEASWFSGGFQGVMRFVLFFVLLVPILIHFGIGQCYRSSTLWKRVPLAGVLGLAGVWLLAPRFDQPPGVAIAGGTLSLTLLLGGGLAAAALILMALITTEHYMTRRTPALIATYVLAWRGRFGSPAVGLAVVRGALVGLLLAGLETALYQLFWPRWSGASEAGRVGRALFSGFVDPSAVGQAAASFSPALLTVFAAVFDGTMIGLLCFGGQWAISYYKQLQKFRKQKTYNLEGIFGLSAVATAVTIGLRLHFGSVMVLGLGCLLLPMILFLIPAFLFVLYDALSAMVAIGTAVLWTLNYPLLQFFQEVGNGGQWAVFLGWGALVAGGAAVAFRAEIVRHLQRAKAEMQ
jgi:hypothetical protein